MPHAALWVVQQKDMSKINEYQNSFNAARGFVGGATANWEEQPAGGSGFNAARGFVGGAASAREKCL